MSLQRLAQYVRNRRQLIGMPLAKDLADATGITPRTISDLETGKRTLSQGSYSRIEQALRWEPGSVDQILAGSGPIVSEYAWASKAAQASRPKWPRDTPGTAERYDIAFGKALSRTRERAGVQPEGLAQAADMRPERVRAIELGTALSLQPTEVVNLALALGWDTYEALTIAGYDGYGQGSSGTTAPVISSPPDSSIAVGLIDTMHKLFKEFISTDQETVDRTEAEFVDLAAEAALLQRMAPGLSSTAAGMMAVLGQERDLVNRAQNLLAQFTRPTPESSQQAKADELDPQQDPLGQKLSGRDERRDSGHH
ncbi:helix-turn-helix transcriptional regulator [Mycobacteroides stephanolepidis]|uniref:helix-turn-helix transcriptional regulator n=1 Tax=[Mycobacterium] stephanolepidis TaxID=1520670 RepID=UPI0013004631|nr:helix-turn-helix transcriptional regulator [[Mycobacterium] stephanolepidis]